MPQNLIKNRLEQFQSLKGFKTPSIAFALAKMLKIFIIIFLLFIFLVPWLQTAFGTGNVTALDPDQRAQTINALVSGRINKWYITEGSQVKKGDKILEIVDNDSQLIERLESDVENLKNRLQAIIIAKETAKLDFDRQQELNKQGLSSTKKLEKAKIEYKNYISKEADIRNKLNTAESKLSSQKTQVIYAPSDGVIVQTISGDEATIITKGQKLANFIPDNIKYAVELFVDGMDIPLIYPGRKVRLQFEGWPAIQFSGWPSTAIGTFGGVVEVVDPSVSPNGKFRVIIVEDPDDHPWPDNKYLRYGARAKGWVLLETVSVGYELWRQLNNFPPEITRSQVQADKNQNKITNDE